MNASPHTSTPLLAVHNLSVRVLGQQVASASSTVPPCLLQPCQFELHAGQCLTLIGESGAGKSLLAQAIMGLLPPELEVSGQIWVQGHATHGQRQATQPHWGRSLMLLPQEPREALAPHLRVLSQVAEGAHYAAQQPWRKAQQLGQQLLGRLGLQQAQSQWPHQLSGGMAQRVCLAAVQATQAPLLLADEPTKGLDPARRDQVAQWLLAHTRQPGQGLLTITHDLELARQLGGRVMVLQHGQVIEQGPAQQVLTQPQHPYTQALLAAQPSHWPKWVGPAPTVSSPTVVQATGLGHSYGPRNLFSGINLSLQQGQIMAISGPSGCGKTTLGHALVGLVRPSSGHVHWPQSLPRWRYQKLYQDPASAFSPHRKLGAALQDLANRHGLPAIDTPTWQTLFQRLKLPNSLLQRHPHQVSGGELQRLGLLRLLMLQPALLVADEPTSRLDALTQRDTMALLCDLVQQHRTAVLLLTHDPHIAQSCAHSHLPLSA